LHNEKSLRFDDSRRGVKKRLRAAVLTGRKWLLWLGLEEVLKRCDRVSEGWRFLVSGTQARSGGSGVGGREADIKGVMRRHRSVDTHTRRSGRRWLAVYHWVLKEFDAEADWLEIEKKGHRRA